MTEIPVEKRNVLILLSLSSFISVFNTCLTCLYKAMTCLHKIYVHAFIKHQCRLCNAYSFTTSCQCNPFETHSICDRASSGPALSDLMTLRTPQPSDRRIVPWESQGKAPLQQAYSLGLKELQKTSYSTFPFPLCAVSSATEVLDSL